MTNVLTGADWAALFLHFAAVSMLAVGGAIAVAPENPSLHRR